MIRQQLAQANIVLGFDVSTSEHQVFFGRDALERISRSGQSEGSFIAAFKYDSGTTELEFLYAAVKHIKGSCDYETKRTGGMGSGIKVRVYDPEERTCRLIPAAELAPGYVAAKVPTVDGTMEQST